MAIQQFDKANLRLLRVDLEEALKAVAEKHGIDLRLGNISFDAGSFSSSVKGRCGAADEREHETFLMACQTFRLDHERVADGFKLVGYRPTARSKPFLLEKGGSRYVCSIDDAKRYFGKPAEAQPQAEGAAAHG